MYDCGHRAVGNSPASVPDVAKEAGIDFKLVSGIPDKHYIVESMTGGVGVIRLQQRRSAGYLSC